MNPQDERRNPVDADQPADVQNVIGMVRQSYPDVKWTRLKVSHPGVDNDGLWFFWLPGHAGFVQIEFQAIWGSCPFLVETDKHDERFIGQSAGEVAGKIVEWLSIAGGAAQSFWFVRED